MADNVNKVTQDTIEQQRALLLSLRSKLVGQRHTLPYTIYKDEEIENLLAKQPHTIEELSQVRVFRMAENVLKDLEKQSLKFSTIQVR